ncbi:MAG: RnfABCDGE type electron transport complex subunit C [Erysipelotrichaceae bacterium]|nr:RnfABCDGE type electron transport complex subunit C [Erysipelotrichaceae bacterium]
MSFLLGPMRRHIDGHKELTSHSDLLKVAAPDVVKIPLVNGAAPCNLIVKEGDKVKVGTKIAERGDHFYVPLFSSVSGTVKGTQKFMGAGLKPVEHLLIENDGLYEEEQSFAPLDYKSATREELVDFMKNAGMVGCGGAGFPSYVKYGKVDGIELLIINAVECEPYITADYMNMTMHLDELATGVRAMFKMSGAKEAKLAIKVSHADFIPTLEGIFKDDENIKVVGVPDVYPMGWERTLVYELTGKRYERLPGEVGCIVNNATTAISFGHALLTGMGITEKVLTVSGDAVKEPHNCLVKVGTSAHDVIEACGGYAVEDEVLLCAGGPMMGRTITTDIFSITTYSNALTVLKPNQFPPTKCLRCGRCSEHCPSGLQPVRINAAGKAADMESLDKLNAMLCIECGMCSYICPSKIDVTEGVRRAKRLIQLKTKK